MSKHGNGISSQTKRLQDLQIKQSQQALADRKRAEAMQAEDDSARTRRAQMGQLSNILASGNQKLGQ